ncbi:MAG: DUF4258 domain-containing protein [Candidatus Thermoplasmatota archaeon]|nr:DUF4258 domain-containing protein [Candidatus Thermoplasmatota archaeon]
MVPPIPKEKIDLSNHAHVRGWDRFDMTLAERKRAIIGIIQTGDWYVSPTQEDGWLVLGRVGRRWICVIVAAEVGKLRVITVWEMTNPGQLAPYKDHDPDGPYRASDVAGWYGL